VPSAGDQFFEEGRMCDRLVQVPRLWIELAAEALDRIGADDGARVGREPLPRGEVLEISLVHRSLLRRAARRHRSEQPRTMRCRLRGRNAINAGLFSPASVRCKCGSGRRMTGMQWL